MTDYRPYHPPFPEHILSQTDIPPRSSVNAMKRIIAAAKIGRYDLSRLLFAGVDGEEVAHNGTFGDEDTIFAVPFIDYVLEAQEADRIRTPADTPYDVALHSSKLPAVVVLKEANMARMSTDESLWQLGEEPKTNKPGSYFDLVVASLVYLPDDERGVAEVRRITGLGSDRVFRQHARFTLINRRANIVTRDIPIPPAQPGPFLRPKLKRVPPLQDK